jgi:hypothetical protein
MSTRVAIETAVEILPAPDQGALFAFLAARPGRREAMSQPAGASHRVWEIQPTSVRRADAAPICLRSRHGYFVMIWPVAKL